MKGAYATYFDNPFGALRMDRPAYKAQAEYSHRAVTEATPGAVFTPLLVALDLADDRAAIAHAQRRLKAQLELTFDKAEKVYSFFDFSAAKVNKSGKVKVVVVPKPA